MSATARKVVDAVKRKAIEKFHKMEERYGRKGAIAVMAATVILTPIPAPGTSLVPMAIAEASLAIGKLFKGRTVATEAREQEPDIDELVKGVKELLTEMYTEGKEDLPELTDEEIRKAIEEQLK